MTIVMEKFKASSPLVEVNGQTILSFVNASSATERVALNHLKKCGIDDPKPDQWYPQQAWLDAFKSFSAIGATTINLIGQAIPKSATFPPEIDTIQQAFASLDIAYHMNHRGGEIGYYKLVSYDDAQRKLVMECNTPYPKKFDEGILLGLWNKFSTKKLIIPKIVTEENQGIIVYTLTW